MKQFLRRTGSLMLLIALLLTLLPTTLLTPQVSAADLSTDIYMLPSKTLNDSGKIRQNMSFIIRTRNGKIIVIDGGYSNDNLDANYLISQLQSITGKDVPNIDAWFFTHNHGDHVGAFKAIAARMPEKVTVTAVYYRFPTDAEIDKYAPEDEKADLKTSGQSFKNHVAKMKQANGQPTQTVTLAARHVDRCNAVFNIDTVQIDVLMTCEEVFWGCDNITTKYSGDLTTNGKKYSNKTIKQLVEEDFGNNTTAVFRLSSMGQSILFLGDAAEPEGIMLRYYHDQNASNKNKYFSLKSDVVQMAHHGQNAVAKNVYTAIDPDIALWTAPDWLYNAGQSSNYTTYYTKQWMSALGVTSYVSKDGLQKVSFKDARTDELPAVPEELKPLVFDATYYANKYADVKKAYGDDEAKLYNHFLKYGIEEGRCASPYFDVKYYMSQNSARMSDTYKGNYEKGFGHFLTNAYVETELTGGGAKKLSIEFDCKYYYNSYPILKELGLKNEYEILNYYVTTGKAAGHKGSAEVVTLNGGIVYHTVSNVAAVAPTCTTAGKTAGTKCATCGLALTAQKEVAALGHSYDNGVVTSQPTCTAEGVKTYTCATCKTAKTEAVAALGHSYSANVTAPTCTEQGYTTHTCSRCADSYKDSFVDAADHSWNNGEITTQSTCTATGVKTYTCTDCGASKTEAVAMTGHTEVIDEAVAPTCTENGLTEGKHCATCGKVIVAQTTVDALGHTEVIDEAVAPTCTETGLTQGSHCETCGEVIVARGILDALGHSYKYADNSDKTHTVTCENCDFTEIADCVFENGECICGATEVSAPIYDETIKFSHSLTLENDISINFIGQGSVLSSFDSFYLECTVPVYEGNEKVGTETVNIEPSFNGTNYEFTLLGITAKMMNDDIEAVLRMTKDGQEYYSKTDVYSVAEYAYGKLNSTKATDTDALKAICANLLRYGALAQTQFNYRTDSLVDANMTDAHKAYLTDLATVEMKDYRKQLNDLDTVIVPWKSTTLELGNKVIMCLIVNLSNYTGDSSELTMRLTFTDNNGAVITEERALELYNPDALTYAVSYDGLRATEMRSIVNAAIYNGDTRVSKTVEYSIESYGARSSDPAMQTLCLAMLAYGDAANTFFSK